MERTKVDTSGNIKIPHKIGGVISKDGGSSKLGVESARVMKHAQTEVISARVVNKCPVGGQ